VVGSGCYCCSQAWLVSVVSKEVKDDVTRESGGRDAAEERVSFKLIGGCLVQPDVELPAGHPRVPSAP